MDARHTHQGRGRWLLSPGHVPYGPPRLAHELRLDDGTVAHLREPCEWGGDGPIHRRSAAAGVWGVRRARRGHDPRSRPEARTQLEVGTDDGGPRLEARAVVQLHRGALDSRGDAVP